MKQRSDTQIWKIGIPQKMNPLEIEQVIARAVEAETATPVLIERIDIKGDKTTVYISGETASLDLMAKHLAVGKVKADVMARQVEPGDLLKPI